MEIMLPIRLTRMGECHDVMSIGLTRADATRCETCWDTNGLFALLNRIIFRLKERQSPTLLANSLSRLINWWCSINHSSFLNRFVAIVIYSSHAQTKTQQNYVQIEKETLAVVFGCETFHQFVYGRTVEVETDHRPLQSINKPLQQAPARLQRFLLQLQKYDLQVTYKPGKYLHVADTLRRSYLQETKEQLVPETEINAINPRSYVPISPEKYAQFQRETAKDL